MLNKLKVSLILGATFALTQLCFGVALLCWSTAEDSWIIQAGYVIAALAAMWISYAFSYAVISAILRFGLTFENYSRIERFIDWVIPDR